MFQGDRCCRLPIRSGSGPTKTIVAPRQPIHARITRVYFGKKLAKCESSATGVISQDIVNLPVMRSEREWHADRLLYSTKSGMGIRKTTTHFARRFGVGGMFTAEIAARVNLRSRL